MDELRELVERPAPAEVVVVGGGYAGVELAATVAEKLAGQGRVKVNLSCTATSRGTKEIRFRRHQCNNYTVSDWKLPWQGMCRSQDEWTC